MVKGPAVREVLRINQNHKDLEEEWVLLLAVGWVLEKVAGLEAVDGAVPGEAADDARIIGTWQPHYRRGMRGEADGR